MRSKTVTGVFVVLTIVFAGTTAYYATSSSGPVATVTSTVGSIITQTASMTVTSTLVVTSTVTPLVGAVATTATAAGSSSRVVGVQILDGAATDQSEPGYAPDSITVMVGVNNTVTWTNQDFSAPHTVTSLIVPTGAALFDSGNIPTGASYTYTFTVPGTYQYICGYHPWMKGTVVVLP